MSDTNKPREFWIIFDKPGKSPAHVYIGGDPAFDEAAIHVIEASAYDALKAERDELRTSLNSAVEALEFYANGEHFSSFTGECVERGDKADELLTKLKVKHGRLK